ncbi:hypothetical protein G9464_00520 [Halostella sp. JP-L12]|uniref:hypothetical protein n=1 Tax=Halostella TaxID=1843185 RepID=UPI000EF7616F|nr:MULTISPECIES: hypothetical protein [Halostella]NHN46081.1 hypothetical protein [Halostella sp. JP-L12]
MHPKRLADLLFLYAGALNVAQYAVANGLQFVAGSAWQLLTGLFFCLYAGYRWVALDDDAGPTEYGPLIYFLVALCAVLTVLTLGVAVG